MVHNIKIPLNSIMGKRTVKIEGIMEMEKVRGIAEVTLIVSNFDNNKRNELQMEEVIKI